MKRLAVVLLSTLVLVGLTAAPIRAASPRFFFEKGYDAVSFWQIGTATERTRTGMIFFTAERGSTPRDHTTTFFSYSAETEVWDGAQWQMVSAFYALAHSDREDAITYTIGPGGRKITASATAQAMQCTPSFPSCTPAGTVQLQANWVAIGTLGESPGHHITDWNGSGCHIDFRSGRTLSFPASVIATIDGQSPSGDLGFSGIETFQGVEVQFCTP